MKLLLDQNLSYKLIKELDKFYPGSNHVYLLGLHNASDEKIWKYARDKKFAIVTQDSDFNERSLIYGYPPKVIWIRVGNVSTQNIKTLLVSHRKELTLFNVDKDLGTYILK